MISERDMVPDFLLASTTGRRVQLSDYRGRRNLVLVFVQGGDEMRGLLRMLAVRRAEIEDEETQVFVIFRGDMVSGEALRKRDSIPFTVLVDADGQVHSRYGADAATLVVADRYGEVYGVYREHATDADDVMASLRHINAACPE